jgi:hypothetical protein
LKLSELIGTAIPTGSIRCDSCLKTHKARDGSHALIGVLPNFQFCVRAGKFTTWTQLAIPHNFLSIPNLERD